MRENKIKEFIKFILIPIILISYISSAYTQENMDFEKLSHLSFSSKNRHLKDSVKPMLPSSSIEFAISFYHFFLEKHDSETCIFSPSCADYWGELAAERGVLVSWVVGFDRIARCSPIHTENYRKKENGLMIDAPK